MALPYEALNADQRIAEQTARKQLLDELPKELTAMLVEAKEPRRMRSAGTTGEEQASVLFKSKKASGSDLPCFRVRIMLLIFVHFLPNQIPLLLIMILSVFAIKQIKKQR